MSEDIILGDTYSLASIYQNSLKFGTFPIILLSVILNPVKLHKYTFHNVTFIKQSTLTWFLADFSAEGHTNNKYDTTLESYDRKE